MPLLPDVNQREQHLQTMVRLRQENTPGCAPRPECHRRCPSWASQPHRSQRSLQACPTFKEKRKLPPRCLPEDVSQVILMPARKGRHQGPCAGHIDAPSHQAPGAQASGLTQQEPCPHYLHSSWSPGREPVSPGREESLSVSDSPAGQPQRRLSPPQGPRQPQQKRCPLGCRAREAGRRRCRRAPSSAQQGSML